MEPPSTAPNNLFGLLSIIALVLANAFFVAVEFALVGSRKTKLDELARSGDRRATVALKAVNSLDRYISATQLGITLSSLGLGWIGEPTLAHLIERAFQWLPDILAPIATHGSAIAVAFTLITILHIVLGELMPKALALLYPEKVSLWLAAPMVGFTWVMAGPIKILNGTANLLLGWLGIRSPGEYDRVHSPEEIRMLVEQSSEGGTLGTADARLLEGVFEFSEKNAEEVMTPRTEMIVLPAKLVVEEAADIVARSGRSRYPVYSDSIDEITGVVHAKNILKALRKTPGITVGEIMKPPLFVPGTREVEDVLTDMKRLKVHLAIVLDEYGGTAGLVTMEDLLEEIVGEIYDEHDLSEPAVGSRSGDQLLSGGSVISEVNELLDLELDDTDYTTLGGYLFGQLGRLPRVGDKVAVQNVVFEIAAMTNRRVATVRVLRPTISAESPEGD